MPTVNQKDVLTTGEVARICHVAPRTVSKWFDTGRLRGYRIPGSRDRRIPREQLLAFMRAHGIPLEQLDGGTCRVLLVDAQATRELAEAMNLPGHYELRTAENGFAAGILAQQFRPHVIVLNAEPGDATAAAICANIKASASLQGTKVIAAVEDLTPLKARNLIAKGFDECVPKPYSPRQFVQIVEKATNLIT